MTSAEQFADAVAAWTPYFAFTGGAAAALLGLLFVAMSLRLDLFRRSEVADVRDDAMFAFATFLAAMGLAGLALAPDIGAGVLAAAAALVGAAGVVAIGWLAWRWRRVNPEGTGRAEAATVFLLFAAPSVGLVLAGLLLRSGDPAYLALLAASQGVLLGTGSLTAWLLLSHARPDE